MRPFVSLLLSAFAITSALAFIPPANMTQGVFVGKYVDGVMMHKRIDDPETAWQVSHDSSGEPIRRRTVDGATATEEPIAPARGRRMTSLAFRRDDHYTRCGCDVHLNHDDCDTAVEELKKRIGGGLTFGPGHLQNVWGIRNSVIAFFDQADRTQLSMFDSTIVGSMLSYITNACGQYVAGTTSYKMDERSEGFGYMNYYGEEVGSVYPANVMWGSSLDHC